MKHRRSVEFVVVVAGIAVLDRGQVLHADEMSATLGQQMFAAAMGEAHRNVAQGYLGIEMRDLSEDQLGVLKVKDARGAEIVNLDHDGPACKAGMRMHDVILQVNGQVVENEDQVRRMLRDMPVGRSVSFLISRDGQTQTMTLQLADRRWWDCRHGSSIIRCRRRGLRESSRRGIVFWIPGQRTRSRRPRRLRRNIGICWERRRSS